LFKLGIVVASIDYGKIGVFGGVKTRLIDARWKLFGDGLAKRFAVGVEHETERATKDDTIRF